MPLQLLAELVAALAEVPLLRAVLLLQLLQLALQLLLVHRQRLNLTLQNLKSRKPETVTRTEYLPRRRSSVGRASLKGPSLVQRGFESHRGKRWKEKLQKKNPSRAICGKKIDDLQKTDLG